MTDSAHSLTTQREDSVPAPVSEAGTVLAMIERAARDPSLDLDRLERLMAMRERMLEREARVAFAEALAALQPELPVIDERGCIEVREKGTNRLQQSTSFARWEDINDAIKPILGAHGFSLSFRTGVAADGKLTTAAILRHRAGYQEETTLTLPHDSSGSKNAVQAVGSSTSYGKRYTAMALLNITSRAKSDRDDDGTKAGQPETVSDEQSDELRKALTAARGSLAKFLDYFDVESVEDLPAKRFAEAMQLIARRGSR